MTLTAPASTVVSPTAPASTVVSPTVRHTFRRWLFWIGAIAVALLVTLVSVGVVRSASAGDPLSASSPTPTGAKALVEVLRQHGVTVVETNTLKATRRAATGDTAVFVYDPETYLADAALRSLSSTTTDLVLMAPDFSALQQLAPAIAQAGDVSGTRTARCDLRAATRASTLSADGVGFRIVDTGADATGCFPARKGVYSVVQVTEGGRTTTAVGATTAFDNGHITRNGNAALALNLLGEHSRLVWYLPSPADAPGGSAPSLADLTPPWLTGFILIGLLTAAAGAFWRGRRLGALVIEPLPVIVRASETMEGRARLYASTNSRLHALDALRIGTVDRLARALGLPRVAGAVEVVSAAASASGIDPAALSDLLIDAEPASDSELVRLSDELLRLEARVRESLSPATTDPPNGRE